MDATVELWVAFVASMTPFKYRAGRKVRGSDQLRCLLLPSTEHHSAMETCLESLLTWPDMFRIHIASSSESCAAVMLSVMAGQLTLQVSPKNCGCNTVLFKRGIPKLNRSLLHATD